MTAGLGPSKQELVSLLQLLNAAVSSANLTLCDHANEFSSFIGSLMASNKLEHCLICSKVIAIGKLGIEKRMGGRACG